MIERGAGDERRAEVPLRLLFIPPDLDDGGPERWLWKGLDRRASVEVFPFRTRAEALLPHTPPVMLADCLEHAKASGADGYDYVVGHANALAWLTVFRLAGIRTPFAVVPNYNHVNPFDCYSLALASQLRSAGDTLFTGSRAASEAFGRFNFATVPFHAPGIVLQDFLPIPEARARVRARLDIAPDAPLLLYTGRLQPDKAVNTLIRAHAEVRATHPQSFLAIAHHIEDEAYALECRALAGLVGNVRFVRDPSPRELHDLYSASDLFVSLGISEFETFGRSPLEAMACGVVPVVPAYDGFAENIPPEAGMLVPTQGDLAARTCNRPLFVKAVRDLLDDEARQQRMRRACVEAARPFDHAVCLDRFCSIVANRGWEESRGSSPRLRTHWSNEGLPPAFVAMAAQLEDRPLDQLADTFLATKQHPLEVSRDRMFELRRMWFAGFFPENETKAQ